MKGSSPSERASSAAGPRDRHARTAADIAKPDDPACVPCVKMLQQLLNKAESRPKTLLQSLMASSSSSSASDLKWTATPDGVQVDISTSSALPRQEQPYSFARRHWSRLHPPETTIDSKEQPLSSNLAADLGAKAAHAVTSLLPVAAAPRVQATSSVAAHSTRETIPPHQDTLSIICKACSNHGAEGGARAYVMGPTPLSVVICHNRLQHNPAEMEEILTHELMHVYDVQQLALDLRHCETLAYSEVRAAREAECWQRHNVAACVRAKAGTATHNLFPAQASSCVNAVFTAAMADARPFATATTTTTTTKSGNNENSTPNKSGASSRR